MRVCNTTFKHLLRKVPLCHSPVPGGGVDEWRLVDSGWVGFLLSKVGGSRGGGGGCSLRGGLPGRTGPLDREGSRVLTEGALGERRFGQACLYIIPDPCPS